MMVQSNRTNHNNINMTTTSATNSNNHHNNNSNQPTKLPQASLASQQNDAGHQQQQTINVKSNNNSNNLTARPASNEPSSGPSSSSMLLSAPQVQARRKSSLSGNGFFIDYSCTRRRSSAAVQQGRGESMITRNQFLRTCMGPNRRRPSALPIGTSANQSPQQQQPTSGRRAESFCAGGRPPSGSSIQQHQNNTSGCSSWSASQSRANSRFSSQSGATSNSYNSPASNHHLLHVPAAVSLAGSRKTSIFDPVGHSLAATGALRRKSTMTMSSAAAGAIGPAAEQAATMLTVARTAAALQRAGGPRAKSELVQRVPVIGCSPTSIRASLAALDETRRYEKLLRKLKKHQKHKLKRKQLIERGRKTSGAHHHHQHRRKSTFATTSDDSCSECDLSIRSMSSSSLGSSASSNQSDLSQIPRPNTLRRKSMRAVKEVATLMNKAANDRLKSKRRARRRAHGQDPCMDGLSISSTLSFASSHTSLPSIDHFLDHYERSLLAACQDAASSASDDQDDDRDEVNSDDELFVVVNDSRQTNKEQSLPVTRPLDDVDRLEVGPQEQATTAKRSSSIVRKAMRKLASTITRGSVRGTNAATSSQSHHQLSSNPNEVGGRKAVETSGHQQQQQLAQQTDKHTCRRNTGVVDRRRRSISVSGGLNYWHYYYYLRDNSLDAIDDLPVQLGPATSGGDCGSAGGVAAASAATLVGSGGSVMSESERRARLYINYSLARLDILNTNSDPVARLADKLARREQQQQQLDWSVGQSEQPSSQVGEQLSCSPGANWNQQQQQELFDFSQSTDVSLTLSTSSTSLQQSSTSRNSSSLSSPVSTVSSAPSLTSGRSRRSHQARGGPIGGSAGASSASLSGASVTRQTSSNVYHQVEGQQQHHQRQQQQHHHHHHHQPQVNAGGLSRMAAPSHSISSQSVRSAGLAGPGGGGGGSGASNHFQPLATPQNHHQHHHQEQQQPHQSPYLAHRHWQPDHQAQPDTYCHEQQWPSQPPPPPPPPLQQQQHHHHQRQQFNVSRLPTASAGQALRYSHGNLLVDPSAATGRQIDYDHQRQASNATALAGGRRDDQRQADIDHVYEQVRKASSGPDHVDCSSKAGAIATAVAATTTTTNEEELDDFERFNRCYKPAARQLQEQQQQREQTPSQMDGASTRMGRDSHFRLSVKSLRSTGRRGSPSSPARCRSPSAKAVGERPTWPMGSGGPAQATGLGAPGRSPGPRSFLSWDTLTSTDDRPLASPPMHSNAGQMQNRPSAEAEADLERQRRRREAASRRSFRQPRASWIGADDTTLSGPNYHLEQPRRSIYSSNPNGGASVAASKTTTTTTTTTPNRQGLALEDNDRRPAKQLDDDNKQLQRKSTPAKAAGSSCSSTSSPPAPPKTLNAESALQFQFEAQMSEAANLAAAAAAAAGNSQNTSNTSNNNNNNNNGIEMSRDDLSSCYYRHHQHHYCDICSNQTASGGRWSPREAPDASRTAGMSDYQAANDDEEGAHNGHHPHDRRHKQNHSAAAGRTRSQSNIVNLVSSSPPPPAESSRTPLVRPSGATRAGLLAPAGDDNWPTLRDSPAGHPGRRCTSASLRVPKWRQQQQQQQQYEDINSELKQQQQQQQLHQTPRGYPLNRNTNRSASSSCNSLAGPNLGPLPATGGNHISEPGHLDQPYLGDQPRARAHSTGANSTIDERDADGAAMAAAASHRSIAGQVAREAKLMRRRTSSRSGVGAGSETQLNLRPDRADNKQEEQGKPSKHLPDAQVNHEPPQGADDDDEAQQRHDHQHRERQQSFLEREQRNLCLLRKNTFNCMVVGGRQTGKRTIVKCFVKLLNEFKLAADEYKKEKMLSKLMECSERLNELTNQQEAEAAAAAAAASNESSLHHSNRRRSRLNSWLPGGTTVNKLLHFSPKNKQRLHSVVGIWAPRDEASSKLGDNQQQQQRRHTTFIHNTSEMNHNDDDNKHTTSGSSRFLNVDNTPGPTGGRFLSACGANKSDTNLNYSSVQQQQDEESLSLQGDSVTVHQLRVPALNQASLRKHSAGGDVSGRPSNSLTAVDGRPGRASAWDINTTANNSSTTTTANRRHTNAAAFNYLRPNQADDSGELQLKAQPDGGDGGGGGESLPTNLNAKRRPSGRGRIGARKQSMVVGLSRRRRRMLLSLKELNRRRCGIRFKTRRQISEACLEQLRRPVVEDIKRRASIMATNKSPLKLLHEEMWLDAFLVVYSINDRDSFEYAKKLVSQLRATKQDVPLPIILVANKIDLERVRVVKGEEGRNLARKNACKFMELSCTVGFNLDNLLVGLRTQLILRHHIILNSILRGKSPRALYKAKEIHRSEITTTDKSRGNITDDEGGRRKQHQQEQHQQQNKGSDNILIRFYKRYVMDNSEENYDYDNFSKL